MDTVGKWMDWRRADYSLDEAQTWIESCQQNSADGIAYEFALVDPKTGEFFGGVGINQINTAYNFANIGYWVRRSREGRGLATAAVQRLTEFAFKELKLTRVELVIRLDNLPSRRVAEKVVQRSSRSRAIGLCCTVRHWKVRSIRLFRNRINGKNPSLRGAFLRRSNLVFLQRIKRDCFVAALLAMTKWC